MKSLVMKQKGLIILGLFLLYCGFCALSSQEEAGIAILGYHDIVSDEVKDQTARWNMWIAGERSFREQMTYLKEQGYQIWSLDDLYAWYNGDKELNGKAVVLTFDDGYLSSAKQIPAILREYGFQGATFVIGSLVSDHSSDLTTGRFVSQEEIKATVGMRYYSHSYQLHERIDYEYAIDQKTPAQLQADFDAQRKITDCSYFAYPYGHANASMKAILAANQVKLAFGYHENRKAKRSDDRYDLPRFSVNAYTSMDTFRTMLEGK